MKTLPKQYDHKEREKYWQEQWGKSDVYHFRDDKPREQTFVIDTPPPTVSGVLHMGHIFSYTQADFVARYQRMAGKDVFYPMGFDDNGLPTERLVEKEKGVRGSTMPRADFVALCREVVKDAEEEFRKLFKSTALSVDWRQEYQTISDAVRRLSQASFIDLWQKKEAYRDFRPTYWDWVDQTAIAQAEIENREMPGTMNDILFTLEDGTPITIATTRPELLGACVAVMYHPEDPNAASYDGKFAVTPLFGVLVPMIADELVEREKGTGLVMCCTYGDDTDKEWWRKHQLPSRPILGLDGKIAFHVSENENLVTSDTTPYVISFTGGKDGKKDFSAIGDNCKDITRTLEVFEAIRGLKPKQANAKMLELLQAAGVILKQVSITHTVKCAERSQTPIEIIPTHQWFVKITDKKEALLAKGADCTWYPEFMRMRLDQWIEGLKEDWCISRQRFFGVPFPVWYVLDFEKTKILETIVPAVEELPIDPMQSLPKKYQGWQKLPNPQEAEGIFLIRDRSGTQLWIEADIDVMDTWATSSISPQINAGAVVSEQRPAASEKNLTNRQPPATSRYEKLFPADLRPQAHEIIRTWAFYTIVKAYLHADKKTRNKHGHGIPWKSLMISGWCLAADKSKMSKSKGNVITPVALIEEKGSDAVRYWASTSRLATDTAFSEDLLKIGRKLVNKLWNVSNFASLLSKLSDAPTTAVRDKKSGVISETLDLWILSRLHQCIRKATEEFERFEYCEARVAIEDFFWNDFCDNYLELVKARAYGEAEGGPKLDAKKQQSALYTIYHCFETLLRLFAPFVPHITEELYSHIFDDRYAKAGSVHARGQWPAAADYPYDAKAELAGIACVDILNVIRKAKSEAKVSIKFPVKSVEVSVTGKDAPAWKQLAPVLADLQAAGNAQSIVEAAKDALPVTSEKGWFSLKITLADAVAA